MTKELWREGLDILERVNGHFSVNGTKNEVQMLKARREKGNKWDIFG